MYIRLPENTKRLYNEEILDDPVVPDEDGVARVSAREGEALVERYSGVTIVEDEREGKSAEDERDVDDSPEDTDDSVNRNRSGDDESSEATSVAAEDPDEATEFEQAMEEVEDSTDPETAAAVRDEGEELVRDDPEVEAVDGDLDGTDGE